MTSTARSVFSSLSKLKPDFVSAAGAVIGFLFNFGDSDEDISGERHKEVMQGIQDIKDILGDGFSKVFEGLNQCLANDAQIMSNQKMILDSILYMHENIIQKLGNMHSDLSETLSEIKEETQENKGILREILEKDIKSCLHFLFKGAHRLGEERRIDSFNNYDDLSSFYARKRDVFAQCYDGLYKVFFEYLTTKQFHTLLKLRSHKNPKKPYIEQALKNYEEVYHYCQERKGQDFEPLLAEPLYPEMIRIYVLLLLEVFPFEELVDKDKNLYSQEDLSSKDFKPLSSELEKALQAAKRILEVAFLQQKVLSGHMCMEEMLQDLESGLVPERMRLYKILRKNPIIAQNLFTESLHKTIKENDQTFLLYAMRLYSRHETLSLKEDFDYLWDFRYRDGCSEDKYCMHALFRVSPLKMNLKTKHEMLEKIRKDFIYEVDIPIYEEKLYCHKFQKSPPILLFGEKEFQMRVETEDRKDPFPHTHLKFSEVKDYSECTRVDYLWDGKWHGGGSYGLNVAYVKLEIVGYKKGYPSKELVVEGQKCDRSDTLVDVRYISLYPYSQTYFFDLFFAYWKCRDIVKIKDYSKRGFELHSKAPYKKEPPERFLFPLPNIDLLRAKDYVETQEKDRLLDLRHEIIQRQAENDFLKSANDEERAARIYSMESFQ